MTSGSPIFLHSLFRSGSTYLFNVFRRSASGYWCYQEPLHEAVLDANEDPRKLLHDRGDTLVKELRHPALGLDYFQELHDVWPAWKDTLTDKSIYDGYFAPTNEDIGIPFLKALAMAARGRPVFQECRTAGRIAAFKRALGGTHIYLWRNPWDQWWSYKIARYFDVANLLIITGPNSPPSIQLMCKALRLQDLTQRSIPERFSTYWNRFLTAEESYLVFYMLWCHGMYEGMKHADLMLSIDQLSDSTDYKSEMLTRLRAVGIGGIDISDCQVPQGYYAEGDQAFFAALERQVHDWLREGGWSQRDIDQIQALRQENQPESWRAPIESIDMVGLSEQASRARGVARRFETTLAERARSDALLVADGLVRAQQAEEREAEARAQAQQERELLRQVQHAAHLTESREIEVRAQLQQALEVARNAQVHANHTDARAQQAQARAEQAERREVALRDTVQQLEALAQQSEAVLESTRQELQSLHQVNHHNWQLAEERGQQIRAMHKSTSWRVTAPLRAMRRALMSPRKYAARIRAKLEAVRPAFRHSVVSV